MLFRSKLRKVSLNRLEQAAGRRLAEGRPITDEMQYLAGLTEIEYLFAYPETGDVVIAGPAGEWHSDSLGRAVIRETGRPVLHLEDLVAVLRASFSSEANSIFGCGIFPRQQRLKQVQEFLELSVQLHKNLVLNQIHLFH